MRCGINAKDLDLLAAIADMRITTAAQLAARHRTSEQMVRRRCRRMGKGSLVTATPRGMGGGRGRPVDVYSTTSKGVTQLKEAGLLGDGIPPERVTGDSLVRELDHQLLLNEVGVDLRALGHEHADLSVNFVSSTCPFHLGESGGSILAQKVAPPAGDAITVLPDAVCSITSANAGKSLLFMVEVDKGTEPKVRSKPEQGEDLRTKILAYRALLGSGQYRRLATLMEVQTRGFRVLLLTNTQARGQSLCRMVKQMAPSDFIWVSHRAIIESRGIGQAVWYPGGKESSGPCSILGSQATRTG